MRGIVCAQIDCEPGVIGRFDCGVILYPIRLVSVTKRFEVRRRLYQLRKHCVIHRLIVPIV
jgi:hypothetical protein